MSEVQSGSVDLDDYFRAFHEYGNARAKILALPPSQRLQLINMGMHSDRTATLELAIMLGEDEIKPFLTDLLEMAAYIAGGVTLRVRLARILIFTLPRVWLLENVEKYANAVLRDYIDYRGILYLYTQIDATLAFNLAQRAATHADPDIREVGLDYLKLDCAVSVHTKDKATGEWSIVPINGRETLPFGAQSTNQRVWGNPLLKQWGLIYLPSIATDAPVQLAKKHLDLAEHEAKTIQEHLKEISEAGEVDARLMEDYIQNFLDAVQVARSVGGTVLIG